MPTPSVYTHKCAVTGCVRRVDESLLMCRPHWYAVPVELRRRVWAGYRGGMGAEYEVAVAAAVDAVLQKQAGA